MLVEKMAQKMITSGLKGTHFYPVRPELPADLNGIGWYIHMPFCRQLCPYCSFRSIKYSADKSAPYIKAVKKEIDLYRDKTGKIAIGDIYFGGGTPSLTWSGMIEIVEYIRNHFLIEADIGFEASPNDINSSMLRELKKTGITRVSLGVQSFDGEILKTMGRDYTAESVLKTIELLLAEGFYVSIDLLYGLPQQSMESLESDLKTAAATGVHQISHYPLMLFSYTRWYHDVQQKRVVLPPSRSEKKAFYIIRDYLTANGYKQDSCWDFTRAASNGSQYGTCTRDENLGIGLSAYTKIGGLFYVNTFSLRDYIERVEKDFPIATGMSMPQERVMRRWFMMALYRLRVEKSEFENRFGVKMEEAMGKMLLMLKLFNIAREHSDHVQVTRQGMYWLSVMTKTSMLSFPARYYEECLRTAWPGDFQI